MDNGTGWIDPRPIVLRSFTLERAALGTLLCLAPSCAFVQFEPSPYAPTHVDAVYSAQEDLTFLSWRLEPEADPSSVAFELASDGGFRPIALGDAPFPAEPYECGDAWCFQFQVPGRVEPEGTLVRARHARFGVFAGTEPRFQEVDVTVDVDPIAIERNARIDPRRFDWFAEEGLPLVRDYAFALRAGRCEDGARSGEGFVPSAGLVDAPPAWTEREACFEATPMRRDAPGVLVRRPLVPSAETYVAAREMHAVRSTAHRTLWGVLFDLAIADPDRCTATRDHITAALREQIERFDRSAVPLGTFEPDDAPDCASRLPERYPVAAMLQAAFDSSATLEGPPRTVLWIYVSNRATSRLAAETALSELLEGSGEIEPNPAYLLQLASSPTSAPSQWVLSYRPIEDRTLLDDIATFAEVAVPFRTMRHDETTEIAIAATSAAPSRAEAKLCQAVPTSAVVVLPTGTASLGEAFPWPTRGEVSYRVDLGSQIGVPSGDYVERTSMVLMEVCARFCDGPVRTANGADLESWSASSECARIP